MGTELIDTTVKSFFDTFGTPISLKVWLDNNPASVSGGQYEKQVREKYEVVEEVKSLSDGYIKAIQSSSADYLFMLEHDYAFFSQNVHHTVSEILDFMSEFSVEHLRFNHNNNLVRGPWVPWLKEFGSPTFRACEVKMRSNRPHILDRNHYLELIEKGVILVKDGSKGIEERFWKFPEYTGTVYGAPGDNCTIRHLDGRGADYGNTRPSE